MDELVLARETLRRRLLNCAEALEKAAAEYDPEEIACDLAARPAFAGLERDLRDYTQTLVHRAVQRAKALTPLDGGPVPPGDH